MCRLPKIGKYAFAGNNNLERVVIPNNVQEIENYAFYKPCTQ